MAPPQLGRYVVQSEIGRGAMGVVYKATDSMLERTVAVKTVDLALERGGAEKYEARFYQEARAAAGLNHPNIVTVHDIGKTGDVVFIYLKFNLEIAGITNDGYRIYGIHQFASVGKNFIDFPIHQRTDQVIIGHCRADLQVCFRLTGMERKFTLYLFVI